MTVSDVRAISCTGSARASDSYSHTNVNSHRRNRLQPIDERAESSSTRTESREKRGAVVIDDIRAIRRPRPPRRQLDTPNPAARQRLLDAAQALVEQHGEAGVRVGDVAKDAGLSVGTFYLYFEGRADLLVQLVQERTNRLRERIAAVREIPGTPGQRLDRALLAYLDFVEESPQAFLHFLAAGALETNAGRLSTWALDQHAADLQPLLEDAIASGEIRPHDPVLLAQALTGLAQHLAGFWMDHRDEYDRHDIVEFIRQFNTFGTSP